jgi:hypothetical protein
VPLCESVSFQICFFFTISDKLGTKTENMQVANNQASVPSVEAHVPEHSDMVEVNLHTEEVRSIVSYVVFFGCLQLIHCVLGF